MARTQLRVQQITSSFGNSVGKIRDDGVIRSTLGAIVASDLSGSLSELASAVKRINGGAAFSANAAGVFTHASTKFGAGGNEFEILESSDTVTLKSLVSDKNLVFNVNDGGVDTTLLTLDAATGDAVVLLASGKELQIGSNARHITDSGNDIVVTSGGKINLAASTVSTVGQATVRELINGNGSALSFDSSGQSGLLKFDTSAQRVHIHDLEVDTTTTLTGDVVIAGTLEVQGSTTTVSSSNLVVQDSIIGLGVSGSDDNFPIFGNSGDRGIIFAKSANQHDRLPALFWDGSTFDFAKTLTSPSSASFDKTGLPGNYTNIRVGNIVQRNNSATFTMGNAQEFTITHANSNSTATVSSGHRLAFGDTGEHISGDGNDLTITSGRDVITDAAGEVVLDSAKLTRFKHNSTTNFGEISYHAATSTTVLSASGHATAAVLELDSTSGGIRFAKKQTEYLRFAVDTNQHVSQSSNIANKDLVLTVNQGGGIKPIFKLEGASANALMLSQAELRFGNSQVSLHDDGSNNLIITSNNVEHTFPNARASVTGQALVGNVNGTLSFADVGGAAALKAVRFITGSGIPLGVSCNFESGDNIDGQAISGLTLDAAQGKALDVFVNGQLLCSGSEIQVQAGERDYAVEPSGFGIALAFPLEEDDVVQIIKR